MSSSQTTHRLPLDPQQRAAAQAPVGHLLVRGGPGSGRTQTLAGRAVHLLSQGKGPRQITAFLDNPLVAWDFRRRVAARIGDQDVARNMRIYTVHTAANSYLRLRGADVLGRPENFAVWGRQRTAAEMKRVARRVLPREGRQGAVLEDAVGQILRWYSVNRQRLHMSRPLPPEDQLWLDVVHLYETLKRNMDALDLHDLVSEAVRALESDPGLETLSRMSYRHVLVDDFHEVSLQSYRLLKLLWRHSQSVTLSSNPAQALGVSEGAYWGIEQVYREEYRNHVVHDLRLDHRSTPELSAAGLALSRSEAMPALSRTGPPQRQTTLRRNGVRPQVIDIPGTRHELVWRVVERAWRLVNEDGWSWDQMAILTCRESIGPEFVTPLARMAIPLTIRGPVDRAGLNDAQRVVAIISLLVRPHDRRALVDAIFGDHIDYTGKQWARLDALLAQASEDDGVPLIDACATLLEEGLLTSARTRFIAGRVISTYRHLAGWLDEDASRTGPFLQKGVEFFQRSNAGMVTSAARHIRALLESAQAEAGLPLQHEKIREILLRYLPFWDIHDHQDVTQGNGLTLSTVRAARGMQWLCVWLFDASDHLVPGPHASEDSEEHLEQQRLFYVASTRAADRLYYCNARGGGLGFESRPTRFLDVLEGLADHIDT